MLNCQCQQNWQLLKRQFCWQCQLQQNWQLLKRQLPLAVETANRNWRQFWSQPRLAFFESQAKLWSQIDVIIVTS